MAALSREAFGRWLIFTISWPMAGLGKLPECFCTRSEVRRSALSVEFCTVCYSRFGVGFSDATRGVWVARSILI
jgi:hypothetical protein